MTRTRTRTGSFPRLAAALAALTLLGADGDRDRVKAPEPKTDAEREAVALAFVGEHHPELAVLLARLKPMRPAEYHKAVRELAQVSRSLQNLQARDPKRYELGLDAWKTRSRVDLLAARLASEPSARAELESQLRQAVAEQVEAQTRQQRYERDQAQARLRQLETNLKRLEAEHDAIVATRVQALLKKGKTAGNAAAKGKARTRSAAPRPAQPRPKPADPMNENPTQGETSR